jgi:uncharacterized protein (DUF2252 family)
MRWRNQEARARNQTGEHVLAKLVKIVDGRWRIKDHRPFVFHPSKHESFERDMPEFLALYRESLPDDRRFLLDRYRLVDVAMKMVGVGSVGTRCAVALMEESETKAPLVLQFKEASSSVLEPYAGRSVYTNQGQRVVTGQHLMQAVSDILLGWSHAGSKGHQFDFYFRQLRDMKGSFDVDRMSLSEFTDYAKLCGWALARAHAKSGDAAAISGYLGKSSAIDQALGAFAETYADQVESDHARLRAAVRSGRIKAEQTDC